MEPRRTEYPRPDFVRKDYLSLNGTWNFAFARCANDNSYLDDAAKFTMSIQVPFVFQSKLSGIGQREPHEVVWYNRSFSVPPAWQGRQIHLHFGAVDYQCTVWVNGKLAGTNRGGYVPFCFDITTLLVDGENELTVKVTDEDVTWQPRGKQSANRENWGCWYTRSTGIWQSVWLEPVAQSHIEHLRVVPDIDAEAVMVEYVVHNIQPNQRIAFRVSYDGEELGTYASQVPVRYSRSGDLTPRPENKVTLSVTDPHLWTPDTPHLYDLTISLYQEDQVVDEVETYFGMRKMETRGNRIYLNNEPVFLRMVLDQGWWPDGICTPGSVEEYEQDVQAIKACGFNGVRKHQKIEDPYFYYYCDKIGLLVWAEMPSCYIYDESSVMNITQEWQRVVRRLYNFPAIMAWVPMNESWGVEQLHQQTGIDPRLHYHLDALYFVTKALDPWRLVVSNDGWQQATTDLITIHDYTQDAADLRRRYREFTEDRWSAPFSHKRPILLYGYEYVGQPILISEYGGVKVEAQGVEGWGYGQAAADYPEMLERMTALTDAILAESEVSGYCYTQLTDVEQEVNGLLTFDRRPKVDVGEYAKIFGRGR